MTHTRIPEDELKVFESLKDVKVVFDVGARDDVDYLLIKPDIKLHCFEPNPRFFEELRNNVGDYPNVYLNNWGAGDVEGKFRYDDAGECIRQPDETGVLVKRLDNYIKENRIRRIDFLKIDTEGYEPQVIRGLGDKIKICRYIQYEQGQSGVGCSFDRFVPEDYFDLYYTGYRNVLAVRKGEEKPWIPPETHEGGQPDKTEANYLPKR